MAEDTENKTKEPDNLANLKVEDKKKGNKNLIVIIVILNLLILGAGGGYFYFFKHGEKDKTHEEAIPQEPTELSFLTLPEIIVNLKSNKPRGNILKATFVLQMYKKIDETKLKESQPIVIDQIMSYLREQTLNELEGNGLEIIKQSIFDRVNTAIKPLKIYKIMIKEFIVQ